MDRAFPGAADNGDAERWRRGMTGEPLVDAGMRELFVTGTMHNRVRMVVASYLTKHLLTDWRVGLAWFEDCLVDWDPASNALNWQWVAGSGPDAAPYFRIFNPAGQADRYDPDGHIPPPLRARLGTRPGPPPTPRPSSTPLRARWKLDPRRRTARGSNLAPGRPSARARRVRGLSPFVSSDYPPLEPSLSMLSRYDEDRRRAVGRVREVDVGRCRLLKQTELAEFEPHGGLFPDLDSQPA